MTTLCTNAKTGAATEYTNYGFESFCRAPDGNYYGIKAGGLYLLSGETDDGAKVNSIVDYGDIDFGTSELKHLLAAYANVASSEYMALLITQEGDEYEYLARSCSDQIKTQRFDTGKGLRANFFGVSHQLFICHRAGCSSKAGGCQYDSQ